MTSPKHSPISVLSRYLFGEFWTLFSLILLAFTGLYVVIDLFDRLSFFLRNDASAGSTVRYLAFKIPLILTQMVPPAVLTAVLLSLGVMARRNELTALRASGVSIYRIGRPLLVAAGAISLVMLAWGETIVPLTMQRQQEVTQFEIRHEAPRTILGDHATWYHGSEGFYHIDFIDRDRKTLYGVAIYHVDDNFDLTHTVEINEARWADDHWEVQGAVERHITPTHDVEVTPVSGENLLARESPEDFLQVSREPEELSYVELRGRIDAMSRKGIDASSYLVDLQLKLAIPFMSFVLAALGIPIAARPRRHSSVAITLVIGIVVGFFYWLTLGFGVSLGHTGAIPPIAAAWAANIICLLAATFLFLSVE